MYKESWPWSKKKKRDATELGAQGAIALTAPIGAGLAGNAWGNHIERSIRQNKKGRGAFTDADIKELEKAIELPSGVGRVKTVDGGVASFQRNMKTIFHHPNAPLSAIAHEMGHASGKAIPTKLRELAGKAALPVLAVAVGSQLYDPDSTAARLAVAAPAIAMLPELAEEGRASLRAMKALKAIGKNKGALKLLLPAFGSYAMKGIGATLALEGTRRLLSHFKKESHDKTAYAQGIRDALNKVGELPYPVNMSLPGYFPPMSIPTETADTSAAPLVSADDIRSAIDEGKTLRRIARLTKFI